MNYTDLHFTENTKMAELVITNPKLLLTLSRFGIELGFGDHSVKEVCEKANVLPSFFLLICNLYSNPDFVPSQEDIKFVEAKTILSYLSESHKYYLDERLPHIEAHLEKIIDSCPEKFGNTIKRFFNEYKDEVESHFKYEEDVVFPYINSLYDNNMKPDFSISEFKSNHSNIEDKLSDLMNILIKYLPANIYPKERIEISLDIMEVTSDLRCHTLVEDRILVPFVEMMEG